MGRPPARLRPGRPTLAPARLPWQGWGLGWRWQQAAAWQKALVIVGAVAVLAALAGTAYWLVRSHAPAADGNVNDVMARVSRHYLLPSGETPALATVTDPSKLKTPFFKDVRTGDRILIYQSNQIAIIYRPSADRIVAVGPVAIDTPKGGTAPAATPTPRN